MKREKDKMQNQVNENQKHSPGERIESPRAPEQGLQPTERPWRVEKESNGVIYIKDTDDRYLATAHSLEDGVDNEVRLAETAANAELIVRAVNAQEALVGALRDVLGFLNVTPLRLNEGDSITLSMITHNARAALRLATKPDTGARNAG